MTNKYIDCCTCENIQKINGVAICDVHKIIFGDINSIKNYFNEISSKGIDIRNKCIEAFPTLERSDLDKNISPKLKELYECICAFNCAKKLIDKLMPQDNSTNNVSCRTVHELYTLKKAYEEMCEMYKELQED